MQLILWRHAEAEDGVPDAARALTAKGRRQAEAVARWLEARLGRDARILVSPAVRAQQTAAPLGRPFETVAAIAPGGDAAQALEAAGWPDAPGTVLLVGHQPALGRVASRLLFGVEQDFGIRKGGVVWIGRRRGAEERAVLKAAITPEML